MVYGQRNAEELLSLYSAFHSPRPQASTPCQHFPHPLSSSQHLQAPDRTEKFVDMKMQHPRLFKEDPTLSVRNNVVQDLGLENVPSVPW